MNKRTVFPSLLLAGLGLVLAAGMPPGSSAGTQRPYPGKISRDQRLGRRPGPTPSSRRPPLVRRRAAPVLPTWAFGFQGDREDQAKGAFAMPEGGVIFWGTTRILGGSTQAWMGGLSPSGAVEWCRVYGPDSTYFNAFARTADGGFVAAGGTTGAGLDAFVVKMTAAGLPEWGRQFGSDSGDQATGVQQTADGGYIVGGITNAYITSDIGDFWVSKMTAAGAVEWSSVLRGPGDESDWNRMETILTVCQASDGGFFVAGDTMSFGAGGSDIWIFKLSPSGGIEWQKTFGGPSSEEFPVSGPHFVAAPEGGLIVACTTASFGASGRDGWLFQISAAGDIVWQKRIGGPSDDSVNSVQRTSDGGLVLGGDTTSFPDDGFKHGWLVKLDAAMAIQWQKSYGQDTHLDILGLHQGPDGGIAAGGSKSPTKDSIWYWDVNRDAFVLKIGPDGTVGAPGNAFVSESAATVADTTGIAQDTAITPLPGFMIAYPLILDSTPVTPISTLLSWTGVQPPIGVTVTRDINRGLFNGEAFNTVRWDPNPWNSRFELLSYAIYRSVPNTGGLIFARQATVPANAFVYVDQQLGLTGGNAFYVVTAIDVDGHESPVSVRK